MIPILGLWDVTCQADATLVNTQLIRGGLQTKSSAYLTNTTISNHQSANELGFVRWADDPATALDEFKDAYKVH